MPSSEQGNRILAINCGSSSIKAKLFQTTHAGGELQAIAEASIKNIASKGEKVVISVKWLKYGTGEDVEEDGEDGDQVECESSSNLPAGPSGGEGKGVP